MREEATNQSAHSIYYHCHTHMHTHMRTHHAQTHTHITHTHSHSMFNLTHTYMYSMYNLTCTITHPHTHTHTHTHILDALRSVDHHLLRELSKLHYMLQKNESAQSPAMYQRMRALTRVHVICSGNVHAEFCYI